MPPLATGTVPKVIAGVVVPVATLMGAVPVTLVTVPAFAAVHAATVPFELRTLPVVPRFELAAP